MSQRPSRFAYVLLMLMTVFSMGGPFALWRILDGGEKEGWPPDRAVEWVAVVVIVGGVVVLMTTILVYGITFQRRLAKKVGAAKEGEVRP